MNWPKTGRGLKRIAVAAALVALVILLFLLKNQVAAMVTESTDLSSLTVNGIRLDQNMAELDLSRTPKDPSFTDKKTGDTEYTYYKDFSIAYNKSGEITILRTMSPEGVVSAGEVTLQTLAEAAEILGKHYTVRMYDYDQGLRARVYYDKKSRIKASLVYPHKYRKEGTTIWAILERY